MRQFIFQISPKNLPLYIVGNTEEKIIERIEKE